jgi:hypothetical protein
VPVPQRDYELSLEFSYAAAILPGLTVQPILQVIFHPGARTRAPGYEPHAPMGGAGRTAPTWPVGAPSGRAGSPG